MKRSALLLLALTLCAPVAKAQQGLKDSVIADGDVHRVVMENEHIRVLEARASYPVSSPMHSHPPMVFISLDTARARFTFPDGKTTLFDTYPGQVIWMGEGMIHSWQLLGGKVNVIAVEIKSAAQKSAQPLAAVTRKANDSVTVDPDVHHVLFENEHVRVFNGRASKGGKSPMHSHPPSLLVPLSLARMKLTLPDGKHAVVDFTPGQVMWMAEPMEHSWEVLSGDPNVIAVEVKSAQRAMAGKAGKP